MTTDPTTTITNRGHGARHRRRHAADVPGDDAGDGASPALGVLASVAVIVGALLLWLAAAGAAMSGVPRLVVPGWDEIYLLGAHQVRDGGEVLPAMALVHYPDGRVAFRHVCDRGDRGLVVCAPFLRLRDGHRLVSWHPPTVEPSILCPDCGTHGFVTAGRWVGV